MKLFKNIKTFFPKDSRQTDLYTKKCYKIKGPVFISLKTDRSKKVW